MTLNDYQKAAERTSGDLTSWDKVRNGCYGLNGEAGECIDILKKTEFQGHAFDPMKMVDELGDVVCRTVGDRLGCDPRICGTAQCR